MSADFEDWTRGIELVVDVTNDFPDWTMAAQVTGGSSGGYKSLTGPGQTATPGKLTQLGPFEVDSNGCQISVDTVVSGFPNNVVITSADGLYINAPGFIITTNEGTFQTSGSGFVFSPGAGFTVIMQAGLVVQQGETVQYGTSGAGATSGSGIFLQDVGVTNTSVQIMVHHGNPNGAITPSTGSAGFCIDTSTPKLWAWAQGASSWVGV